MARSDGKTQIGPRIDTGIKARMDASDETMATIIESGAMMYLKSEDRSAVEMQIKHNEDQIQLYLNQIKDLQRKVQGLRNTNETLQDRLDEMSLSKDGPAEILDELLETLEEDHIEKKAASNWEQVKPTTTLKNSYLMTEEDEETVIGESDAMTREDILRRLIDRRDEAGYDVLDRQIDPDGDLD